jgi:diaminobutyrate-2-oxoglutarate transaminase
MDRIIVLCELIYIGSGIYFYHYFIEAIMHKENLQVFEKYESTVRSYCRNFAVNFIRAKDSFMYDEAENQYVDLLSGAGALNYGHNNTLIKDTVIRYMQDDGIMMSLDLHTRAKAEFLLAFNQIILEPRKLDYKVQFTSPSGTSVVESAVKLARKVTGRHNVICFTNGFHGMSGTSLSLTGNREKRQAVQQGGITRLPFDGYLNDGYDSIAFYRKLLSDASSGIDLPAAIILETIQGEGGVNVASISWLKGLKQLCEEFDIKLIIDDIQAGCGRTGAFFSFERAEIVPDLVCLSKSIGGIGFPMAILLIAPEMDKWNPGEDNGTFRGNNLAFIAAKEMLEQYWCDDKLVKDIQLKEVMIVEFFKKVQMRYSAYIRECRGIGLIQGIEFHDENMAKKVVKDCFIQKILIETCGAKDQVVKFMTALTIESELLQVTLDQIAEIIAEVCLLAEPTITKSLA